MGYGDDKRVSRELRADLPSPKSFPARFQGNPRIAIAALVVRDYALDPN